jgi:PAS domain S-box-containing protein
MKDQSKTKQVLIQEMASLKQRIAELERSDSERKGAEEALRESEERYNAIFDRSLDCIYVVDFDGNFIDANPAALTLLGYERTDIRSLNIVSLLDEKDLSKGLQDFSEIIQVGFQKEVGEYRLRCKDGRCITLETQASVVYHDDKPHSVLGIARDITYRKRVEERSRRESLFRQSIIDSAAEGICACHDVLEFPHTRFTVWNQHMTNITGYTMDEINSQGWYQSVYPDPEIQAKASARMARMRQGDNLHQEEWEITRKDGQRRQLLISTCIVPGGETGVNALAVMNDITEWKKQQKEIEHIASFPQLNPIMILEVGKDKEVIFCNPAMKSVLNKMSIEDPRIFIPEDIWELFNATEITIRSEFVRELQIHNTVFHENIHFTPEFNSLRIYTTDITERKRAEAQAKERMKELQALYGLAEMAQREDITLDELYKEFTNILPNSWLYPEIACARLVIGDSEFRTENFAESPWMQAAPIMMNREVVGRIEVGYLEERPEGGEGPFLEEERFLIDAIAEQLGQITERKQAEKALRESEERYRNIFETTLEGIYQTTPQGRYLRVNHAFALMLSYASPEDLIGSITDIGTQVYVNPDRRSEFKRHLCEHDRVENFEAQLYRKDGTAMWGLINAVTVRNENGDILYFTGGMMDITERKGAEEALRKSEEMLRLITDNMSDMIRVADLQGVNLYTSPSHFKGLGYRPEERVGKSAFDIIHPDDLERIINIFSEGLAANRRVNIEYRVRHADGHYVWLETVGDFLRDTQGNVTAVVMSSRDISDRKQVEEEKRTLEQRLQHADKMESIGTLAGGIAHDFNNLLMGIQGYASLSLMNLDPSHPNYERLKRIEEQVQSGADLTKQLLGFARGGRYAVKPTDMNDIIEKTSSMFGRTKKEISIHRKYGKDLRPVEVDQGQMDQVFMNLYVNAWQAMPGGGEIYLETENVLLDDEQASSYAVKPGKYVKITVTDTGTGMDEKTKVRIFDPFFTTKEMGRGTGLGLAMVYGIIKGHKGMINVYSEPGHGTTFTIYLPASEKELVQEKTVTGSIARGTETILLVDDEKMVVEVTRELLESLGYRVYAAGSGQEAIAVYMEKRSKIDLVILDMVMPGISGGETYNRLKEISPDIRVLLSSGYSINGEAQSIINRGCNGFIQKPFQLEKLSRSVREAID